MVNSMGHAGLPQPSLILEYLTLPIAGHCNRRVGLDPHERAASPSPAPALPALRRDGPTPDHCVKKLAPMAWA